MPLIYLAKNEQLDILAELPDKCLIPERIESEVVTAGIEEVARTGILSVVSALQSELFEQLQCNDQLTAADSAVLTVAAQRDRVAVMDGQYGREITKVENIHTRGTVVRRPGATGGQPSAVSRSARSR